INDVLNAFFTLCRTSFAQINDSKLKKMSDGREKVYRKIIQMTQSSSHFNATVEVGYTFSIILTAVYIYASFNRYIITLLHAIPMMEVRFSIGIIPISNIIIIIFLTFITLVFGRFYPERLALKNPEKTAYSFGSALYVCYRLLYPITVPILKLTKLLLKITGMNTNIDDESITEDAFRMMVEVGEESGILEQSEKRMIDNILEFDDITVSEVMTHRTAIIAVNIGASIGEIVQVVIEAGRSRILIYKDDFDDIVGVLHIKDLLKFIIKSSTQDFKIQDYMRPPMYIPEATRCSDLFERFQNEKTQIAVVVDEYGGTYGLVTMEDLLESIVGDIQDEYDDEAQEITPISQEEYSIDASVSIGDVEKLFGVELMSDDSEYDTIGGLIIEKLERIPSVDEQPYIIIGELAFTVMHTQDNRIVRVHAKKINYSENIK
ncbi:MAG: hemolysin family protein, partial [Oscillospiraceae bacterium]